MMYPNLEAEMVRLGYTKEDIGRCLNIHISGVYQMLSGKRNLSISRAIKIRDSMFPGMRVDYLFDISPRTGGSMMVNPTTSTVH